jgi:uncharacterized repeat protein (TIGR01451 family)
VSLSVPSDLNSIVTANPQIVVANGIDASTITTILRDAANLPVPAKSVSLATDRAADALAQPALPTNASGATTGTIKSTVVGVSTITATDVSDTLVLSSRPKVFFTHGQVLELRKSASKKEAVVGDVVNYLVEIRNKTAKIVTPVRISDQIPPNFKYVKGSARLNGAVLAEPAGNRPLIFDIGSVPAFTDSNSNGRADPGESGYMTLTYQLVIGSGATPRDYVNTVVATDVCDQCYISNTSDATVTVVLDPLFDLGTIIGKVFQDKNGDGWQDRDEPGVPGAMVVMDNGDYVITDEFGRYHFPAVKPGHRLVKINVLALPAGAKVTTDEALVVIVTPGLLAKANFGVIVEHETETIGRPGQTGMGVKSEAQDQPVQVVGSAETLQIMVNGLMASLPLSDIRMSVEALPEMVEVKSGTLEKPVRFSTELSLPERVAAASWKLVVYDGKGNIIQTDATIGVKGTVDYAAGVIVLTTGTAIGASTASSFKFNPFAAVLVAGGSAKLLDLFSQIPELTNAAYGAGIRNETSLVLDGEGNLANSPSAAAKGTNIVSQWSHYSEEPYRVQAVFSGFQPGGHDNDLTLSQQVNHL